MGDARLALRFVAGLPFEQWAVRLSTGHADLRGDLASVTVTVGGHEIVLGPGPAHLELLFLGGHRPRLAAVAITAPVRAGSRSGHRLRVVDGEVHVDERALPREDAPLGTAGLVTAILDHLSDVSLVARARPAAAAVVRLPEGIEVAVTDRDEISVHARAKGPPSDLVLDGPLHLQFGDHGVHVDHRSARWLARLARLRIRSAHLHPDGRVVLDGGSTRGFDRVMRGGLRTASAHLSLLVRKSPRFQRVRDFLRR